MLLPGVEHRTSSPRSDTLHYVRERWASHADWGFQARLIWQNEMKLTRVKRHAVTEIARQDGKHLQCPAVFRQFKQKTSTENNWTNSNSWQLRCCTGTWQGICNVCNIYSSKWGTRWLSWLRHCGTGRIVSGSISDGVIGIFYCHNPPQPPGNLWAWRGIAYICIITPVPVAARSKA